ncbi:MAG: DNA translocase FtsK [Planctomycetota bacterium]
MVASLSVHPGAWFGPVPTALGILLAALWALLAFVGRGQRRGGLRLAASVLFVTSLSLYLGVVSGVPGGRLGVWAASGLARSLPAATGLLSTLLLGATVFAGLVATDWFFLSRYLERVALPGLASRLRKGARVSRLAKVRAVSQTAGALPTEPIRASCPAREAPEPLAPVLERAAPPAVRRSAIAVPEVRAAIDRALAHVNDASAEGPPEGGGTQQTETGRDQQRADEPVSTKRTDWSRFRTRPPARTHEDLHQVEAEEAVAKINLTSEASIEQGTNAGNVALLETEPIQRGSIEKGGSVEEGPADVAVMNQEVLEDEPALELLQDEVLGKMDDDDEGDTGFGDDDYEDGRGDEDDDYDDEEEEEEDDDDEEDEDEEEEDDEDEEEDYEDEDSDYDDEDYDDYDDEEYEEDEEDEESGDEEDEEELDDVEGELLENDEVSENRARRGGAAGGSRPRGSVNARAKRGGAARRAEAAPASARVPTPLRAAPVSRAAVVDVAKATTAGDSTAGDSTAGDSTAGDSTAGDSTAGDAAGLDEAVRVVAEAGEASVGLLREKLGLGFFAAVKCLDQLEREGVVTGPMEGTRRAVLMSLSDWRNRARRLSG